MQPLNFVSLIVLPRILYHAKGDVFQHGDPDSTLRHKREPKTALTVATLLGLGLARAGKGSTSSVTQPKGLSSLQAAVDEDLERSISHLTSSSEVALQNRRGLDSFPKQGGLCAALGEECCFYADRTGVVEKSMAELRDRLEKKKKRS